MLAIRKFLLNHKQIDPTSFIEAAIVWALINAFSLWASSPAMFERPGFTIERNIGLNRHMLATLFFSDAISLFASIALSSLPFRSMMALLSALIWIAHGATMIASTDHSGIIGVTGLGCIACGVGCLNAVTQWVYVKGRE